MIILKTMELNFIKWYNLKKQVKEGCLNAKRKQNGRYARKKTCYNNGFAYYDFNACTGIL